MEINKLDDIIIVFVILDNNPEKYLLYNGWRKSRVLIGLEEFAIKVQTHGWCYKPKIFFKKAMYKRKIFHLAVHV